MEHSLDKAFFTDNRLPAQGGCSAQAVLPPATSGGTALSSDSDTERESGSAAEGDSEGCSWWAQETTHRQCINSTFDEAASHRNVPLRLNSV